MTADDYDLHEGGDGMTDYLVRTYRSDGTRELMTRPTGSTASWSPPVTLAPLPVALDGSVA